MALNGSIDKAFGTLLSLMRDSVFKDEKYHEYTIEWVE